MNKMQILFDLILLSVLFYFLIVLFMYFRQKSFLFYPTKTVHEISKADLEPFSIHRDKTLLKGWLLNPKAARNTLIIYYGGNSEDVFLNIEQFRTYEEAAFLLVNYRGYSGSTGNPGEKELYEDALTIFDTIISHYSPHKLILMGRSLGSAIATYVGSQKEVDGIILITPFSSIESIAKKRFFFLPIPLILKHKFLSAHHAKDISAPCLIIYGGKDTIVPPDNTKQLLGNISSVKTVLYIGDAGHNDIDLFDEYHLAILTFIQ